MSDRETGVEEARKVLGKLVDDAALDGTVTYLTRRGRRHAAIVPLNRITKEPTVLTDLIATAPRDASWATAAAAWQTVVAAAGLKAEVVGKTADDAPIVEHGAEEYALVHDGTDVWAVLLECGTCSTRPGSVPGEVFRQYRIDPETDEVEFMCGTCWDRYSPEEA